MTAQLAGAAADRADEARGAVSQDEGAALSTVENREAITLPSVGGLLRGVAVALGQVRRVMQTHLAAGGAASRLVDELGSWWGAWATWVLERSGAEVEAPATVGSDRHPPLEPAPGAYVLDRVP